MFILALLTSNIIFKTLNEKEQLDQISRPLCLSLSLFFARTSGNLSIFLLFRQQIFVRIETKELRLELWQSLAWIIRRPSLREWIISVSYLAVLKINQFTENVLLFRLRTLLLLACLFWRPSEKSFLISVAPGNLFPPFLRNKISHTHTHTQQHWNQEWTNCRKFICFSSRRSISPLFL